MKATGEVDRIETYTVRVPGSTTWSEGHQSAEATQADAEQANRTCRPGHCVYAEHASGKTTGPY